MTFRALIAREQNQIAFEQIERSDLPQNEVLVRVERSSLNYKDGLAVTGKGRIVRRFPMVLGIDLAGTVLESSSPDFKAGDRVLGTGQNLGENDWGGYAAEARVRPDAILAIPESLSFDEAMSLGTAGITAMLAVMALQRNEVLPSEHEVVVTGAAGGVGSIAVHLLARRGYKVAASTGRSELADYLRDLGATTIVPREELSGNGGPMQKERWAGGVDTVGGTILGNVFAQTRYGGAVACCGMAASHELNTAVWPLILRNVSLLGVSSLRTPKAQRVKGWDALAREVDRGVLKEMTRLEPLSKIFDLAAEILDGKVRGRIVTDVSA